MNQLVKTVASLRECVGELTDMAREKVRRGGHSPTSVLKINGDRRNGEVSDKVLCENTQELVDNRKVDRPYSLSPHKQDAERAFGVRACCACFWGMFSMSHCACCFWSKNTLHVLLGHCKCCFWSKITLRVLSVTQFLLGMKHSSCLAG